MPTLTKIRFGNWKNPYLPNLTNMKRLIWWIIHKFTAINAKFSKIKMVFTTYLPTLLSTYYYLLALYVFIEVHTMKKKYIVPCHSFWGSLIHMLELVPEHDPSIEEKTQQQPTTTLMIVMMTTCICDFVWKISQWLW